MTEYRTVRLPEQLCCDAEKWLAGRFDNLEALISFLLQEVVRDDTAKLEQAEEKLVQQRLKELGYI
jgi:hypothetical protein